MFGNDLIMKLHSIIIGISFLLLQLIVFTKIGSVFAQSSNFDAYCKDGVYYIQKNGREISCGRAPNCDSKSYESTERIEWRRNAECWVEDYYNHSRCNAYCSGNIPLCCYKLAITKDSKDCTWPERGYCLPSQCAGVGNNCGGSIGTWCSSIDKCVRSVNDIPYIPLEQRLVGGNQTAPQPTNRPTQQPTATTAPQPTQQPTATTAPQPTQQPTATTAPQPTQQPTAVSTLSPTDTPFCCGVIKNESLTPNQIVKQVINYENINSLQNFTAPALDLPKKAVQYALETDKQIESFFKQLYLKIKSFFV